MSNSLEQILNRLEAADADNGVVEKTASEEAPAPSANEKMLDTVRNLSESIKTASDNSSDAEVTPSDSLKKMASEAVAAEDALLKKKAHYLGAALADGFMERYALYDQALSNVKTASTDTDALVKEAYAAARAHVEKEAQAEFERGYNDTVKHIHKTAAELHYAGQAAARNVLNALAENK